MSKDRSTPGTATAAGPGTFAGARGAGGRSALPTAPRERKPALAALAVLLILAGALATMLLVTKSGNRISVVAVGKNSIAAGTKLDPDAGQFVEKSVAKDSGIHYVEWSQLSQLKGRIAYNTLAANTPLTAEMLGEANSSTTDYSPGTTLMGVQIKQGHYPTKQMVVSDKFVLYTETTIPGTNGGPATNSGWVSQGTVTLVARDDADTMTATISVPTDKVVTIANATDLMLVKSY